MPSSKVTYDQPPNSPSSFVKEGDIENALIDKLDSLKYTLRPDIRDRVALDANFREKFEKL